MPDIKSLAALLLASGDGPPPYFCCGSLPGGLLGVSVGLGDSGFRVAAALKISVRLAHCRCLWDVIRTREPPKLENHPARDFRADMVMIVICFLLPLHLLQKRHSLC